MTNIKIDKATKLKEFLKCQEMNNMLENMRSNLRKYEQNP